MKREIISVTKYDEGMAVVFGGDTRDNLEAIGMTLAAAVSAMAMGGTPRRDIERQLAVCVEYGMRRGLEQARGCTDGH